MHTQSRQKYPRAQRRWTSLQIILLTLMILCLTGITSIVLVLARGYVGNNGPQPRPTPLPVISATAAPTQWPTLTVTPAPSSPTPSPTEVPSPTPTPLPSPPPGVLGFPLYSGNPRLPEVALTFDDGPNPPYTSQILAILQRYGVPATFFVIGSQAQNYQDLTQQEAQQGNVIGNHSWSHPSDLTTLPPADVRSQLQSTNNQIKADTGQSPALFRPPGGHYNSAVQSIAADLGLSTILWSVDPRDWSRPGVSKIVQTVLDTTHNGSIILLHDGGGDRSQTVAALPQIISALQQRGFQFVTISRMIQNLPPGGTGPSLITPDEYALEEDSSLKIITQGGCGDA